MKASFGNIAIRGVLGIVPSGVSFFDDELENYSHSAANSLKLKKVMGYDQHRIAKSGTTTSDLACFGLDRLIQDGVVQPDEIDGIFFVSQTPDYLIPATSSYIHGRFGFPLSTYCVDINDGCCGFIKGLYEASAFLTVSGAAKALIICGDVLSPKVSRYDRNSFPLVGDAASITLIERPPTSSGLDIEILNDGNGFEKLCIPAGGARLPVTLSTSELIADEDGNRRSREHLVMQGREVFNFTQTVVPDFILEFLGTRGVRVDQVDQFLLHQANAFILDRIRLKLGVSSDKLPDNVIRRYGNSSSATIPMLIATSMLNTFPKKIFACGFGVGLSWGGALFDLEELMFRDLIEYSTGRD